LDTGGAIQDTAGDVITEPVQDAECDTDSLMRRIAEGAQGVKIPGGCTTSPNGSDGAVVLDPTGKATAITGIYYTNAAATQATVDSLSAERWPCLANQTVHYTCANPFIGP
jgi:hypothetical protein